MNGLDAAIRAQLGQDVSDVKGGSALRDAEPGGNLFVAQTARHQAEHLFFTQRKRGHGWHIIRRRRAVRRVSVEQAERIAF
jgi:hypothetical protein